MLFRVSNVYALSNIGSVPPVSLSFRYGSNRWQCCSSYLSMAQILRSVQITASHESALNDAKGSRARECTCIKHSCTEKPSEYKRTCRRCGCYARAQLTSLYRDVTHVKSFRLSPAFRCPAVLRLRSGGEPGNEANLPPLCIITVTFSYLVQNLVQLIDDLVTKNDELQQQLQSCTQQLTRKEAELTGAVETARREQQQVRYTCSHVIVCL